jgi:hypothetical protein
LITTSTAGLCGIHRWASGFHPFLKFAAGPADTFTKFNWQWNSTGSSQVINVAIGNSQVPSYVGFVQHHRIWRQIGLGVYHGLAHSVGFLGLETRCDSFPGFGSVRLYRMEYDGEIPKAIRIGAALRWVYEI